MTNHKWQNNEVTKDTKTSFPFLLFPFYFFLFPSLLSFQVRLILKRKLHQAVRTTKAQFLRDIDTVIFDRLRAHVQQLGNLLARTVLRDEFQDIAFRRGQRLHLRIGTLE